MGKITRFPSPSYYSISSPTSPTGSAEFSTFQAGHQRRRVTSVSVKQLKTVKFCHLPPKEFIIESWDRSPATPSVADAFVDDGWEASQGDCSIHGAQKWAKSLKDLRT